MHTKKIKECKEYLFKKGKNNEQLLMLKKNYFFNGYHFWIETKSKPQKREPWFNGMKLGILRIYVKLKTSVEMENNPVPPVLVSTRPSACHIRSDVGFWTSLQFHPQHLPLLSSFVFLFYLHSFLYSDSCLDMDVRLLIAKSDHHWLYLNLEKEKSLALYVLAGIGILAVLWKCSLHRCISNGFMTNPIKSILLLKLFFLE